MMRVQELLDVLLPQPQKTAIKKTPTRTAAILEAHTALMPYFFAKYLATLMAAFALISK